MFKHLNEAHRDGKVDTSVKGKGKVRPTAGYEGPEGQYTITSTFSLTSALDGGGWLTPRPGRFIPKKDIRYPLHRRVVGPQGQSGRVRKISPPPGLDPRTVQPVASRYTDRAIPAHAAMSVSITLLWNAASSQATTLL